MSYSPRFSYSIRLFALIAMLLLYHSLWPQTASTPATKTWTIVIDPGHGGADPGAVNGTVKEKDINLAIALKLGKLLKGIEHTKVIYTRETDVAVDLYKRPQIANDQKADLFISIHCNSSESAKPYGAETFVMGLHKSKANLDVARKENAVILLEENYNQKYQGFDPNSPESEIIFSLYQNAFLDQSVNLASLIQKEFRINAQRFDRGVKQAGFLVLYKTNMPGILVEAGFLSNENECKYLSSDAGKTAIANAIFNAVLNYREKIDGVRPQPLKSDPAKKAVETQTSGQSQNPVTPPDPVITKKDPDTLQTPKTVVQEPVVQEKKTVTSAVAPSTPPDTYFSVQFLTSRTILKPTDPALKGISAVHFYEVDGTYRYVSGYFTTQADAVRHKNTFAEGAYKDAFIVAFHKGKRISVTEANTLLGNH